MHSGPKALRTHEAAVRRLARALASSTSGQSLSSRLLVLTGRWALRARRRSKSVVLPVLHSSASTTSPFGRRTKSRPNIRISMRSVIPADLPFTALPEYGVDFDTECLRDRRQVLNAELRNFFIVRGKFRLGGQLTLFAHAFAQCGESFITCQRQM